MDTWAPVEQWGYRVNKPFWGFQRLGSLYDQAFRSFPEFSEFFLILPELPEPSNESDYIGVKPSWAFLVLSHPVEKRYEAI